MSRRSADHAVPLPVSAGNDDHDFSPTRMLDVDLARPLPPVTNSGQYGRLWVLGRLHGEPLGVCVTNLSQDGLTPDDLADILWPAFREQVAERFAAASLPEPSAFTSAGLETDAASWPFLRRRQAVLETAPYVSVVVCTRDRADRLKNCLAGISRQEYPLFEVVVVDNAPTDQAVKTLVEFQPSGPGFRYVMEPRPGLSWARNAGVAAAVGDIIAFLDDDDEPDIQWLAGLAGGFARAPDIGCVSGMVLPARLDTHAQELFEQLGGHCKGRGFTPAIFSRSGPQNPLYPLPPFGVGANMAFRRQALASIGKFDVALGAGTFACAGEDTLALTMLLLAGYRIAYEPSAIVHHHHREDMKGLSAQLKGYSIGLTAYYASLLRHQPRLLPSLIRLVPTAIGYLRGADAGSTAKQGLPSLFRWRQRLWMLAGPLAYVSSVLRQARVAAILRRPI
jgi:O-antigen biosynthesis protein